MREVLLWGASVLVVSAAIGQEVDEQRLSPIAVYGDRDASDPGSYSVIDGDTVIDLAADHPAELLNTLPGVNIQMNSGQEHLIAIRSPVLTGGAGQGSFLILENGVPTRAPAFGNVNSLLEPHHEVASAVEVVRGPGSAKYGSNAVHGLINVFLPEPGLLGGAPGAGAGVVQVSASTLQRYKADTALDFDDRTTAALSLQKDVGWRDFTGLDQQKLSLVSAQSFGPWRATAWLSAQNMHQETAGFIQGFKAYRDRDIARSNANPEAGRDARSARAAVRIEREFQNGTVSFTPFLRGQEMSFRQHFLPYRGFEENGHWGGGLQARWEEIALSNAVILSVGSDIDLSTGFLKETQDDPFGFFPGDARFPVGVHYDYEVDTDAYSVWAEAEWSVSDRFRVLAGLRGEAHEYDYDTDAPAGINGRFNVPEDRSDSFDLLTPKLGAVWDASTDLEAYLNYARGERAPQASDLYRLQSQQIVGEVEEETLNSIEIGLRGVAAGVTFDLAAYHMEKDNFFFRDADGLNVPNGATEHSGLELAVLGDVWASARNTGQGLRVAGSVAWSDQTYAFDRPVGNASEAISSGDRIDTAPEWLADLTLTYAHSDQTEAALQFEYIGEYVTNPANTREYPGHLVTHFRFGHTINADLDAFVLVRNVFDLEYADRADFAFGNDRYFPGEPLNATVGLRKRFD